LKEEGGKEKSVENCAARSLVKKRASQDSVLPVVNVVPCRAHLPSQHDHALRKGRENSFSFLTEDDDPDAVAQDKFG